MTHEVRMPDADRSAPRLLKTARWLTIYGLLVGGAAVFSLPFLWMIGTSFKVDREMFSEKIRIMPIRPVPAEASPYLDPNYFPTPRDPAYEILRPAIEEHLAAMDLPVPEGTANAGQVAALLAPGIYQRLRDLLPAGTWKLSPDRIRQLAAARISKPMATELLDKVAREFRLGSVRVRSFELQEKDLTAGNEISKLWKVLDGPAQIADVAHSSPKEARVAYDFRNEKADSFTLTADLKTPFDADRLFKTQIAIRPDDSWHRAEFFLERNGRRFKGMRPEYLGDFQAAVITLQEYGPDDLPDANKIRLWIACEEVDAGPQYDHGPDGARVTMVVHRSSAAGAWWGKCQRNYRGALDYIPFWRYLSTSALLVFLNIFGNVLSCSLVAYAFARLHWPGRNICFGIMLATMMIPPQVTMIPFFLIVKHLGWYNTLTPLWIMSFFGNAFNIFLLRQFMKGIPRDLEDAAKIDGCNFLQIYWYVMIPLIKPTLACIAIFTFMGVWNDFMGPLIFLSDQRLYPLSLGLFALNVQQAGNFGMLMAGSLLMTLPVIVIFFFAQRYFIQGITLTGSKG